MVNKIAISISRQLDVALAKLSENRAISKSRLIEVCLRENPDIVREISNYQLKEATVCKICNDPFTAQDIKIDTPKYGVICKECWSDKAGDLVVSKSITDT
ncbi:MAG: hypothetical protein WCP39_07995 [Chlamydiota bacterium]